jgi:hypothetical protein
MVVKDRKDRERKGHPHEPPTTINTSYVSAIPCKLLITTLRNPYLP